MAHDKYRKSKDKKVRASKIARRARLPPGQNKYSCGNLQIITRFCETLSRPCSKPPRRWTDRGAEPQALCEFWLTSE